MLALATAAALVLGVAGMASANSLAYLTQGQSLVEIYPFSNGVGFKFTGGLSLVSGAPGITTSTPVAQALKMAYNYEPNTTAAYLEAPYTTQVVAEMNADGVNPLLYGGHTAPGLTTTGQAATTTQTTTTTQAPATQQQAVRQAKAEQPAANPPAPGTGGATLTPQQLHPTQVQKASGALKVPPKTFTASPKPKDRHSPPKPGFPWVDVGAGLAILVLLGAGGWLGWRRLHPA
jgi:hypothetical protein